MPTHPPSFEPFGSALRRPECVLPTRSGAVVVPNWDGGVSIVRADGTSYALLASAGRETLRPNGIEMLEDGSFLLANLHDTGGIWRLARDGAIEPWLLEVDETPLPPANYVTTDARARTWISVSTTLVPRQNAWRPDVADGFIVLLDRRGARIVADGLHYTNECRPDPSGRWLYVVETFGRRLSRFPIGASNDLGPRETVLTFGRGTWPDGFAFDQEGAIWITSLISNRLLRWTADTIVTVLEEINQDRVDEVERAFVEKRMAAEHLGPIPGTELQHVTSIAFGGADLRTAYVGCLHTSCIFRFRSDVPGIAPASWNAPAI
jgi:sugar lactone lactonase YvrE